VVHVSCSEKPGRGASSFLPLGPTHFRPTKEGEEQQLRGLYPLVSRTPLCKPRHNHNAVPQEVGMTDFAGVRTILRGVVTPPCLPSTLGVGSRSNTSGRL